MRRLAKDQATLRQSTPPNYLFPDGTEQSLPDDLTQLIVLVTGAHGTPYSQGVWKLHLRMPEDYPKNPPKATFKTRIYHPNVEENTGAVCLDTLKKDWESRLTLKDILVTISCLLIHPNPDSALNSEAGALLQEDYDAFARKARLMTSIHAPIPKALKDAVLEAKRRGEDEGTRPQIETETGTRPTTSRAASSSTSVSMKAGRPLETSRPSSSQAPTVPEEEEQEDNTKENDPLHSPLSPSKPPPSPRKVLGKRALSELPIPLESDQTNVHFNYQNGTMLLQTNTNTSTSEESLEPLKKSPKLARPTSDSSAEIEFPAGESSIAKATTKARLETPADHKENAEALQIKKHTEASQKVDARPTLRKVSNVGSSRGKGLPRIGIRRL
jgi:ubiquitin-conjugating enzyme E2 S